MTSSCPDNNTSGGTGWRLEMLRWRLTSTVGGRGQRWRSERVTSSRWFVSCMSVSRECSKNSMTRLLIMKEKMFSKPQSEGVLFDEKSEYAFKLTLISYPQNGSK